jgi:uncharacterized protein (DUF2147 family)
MKIAVLVRKHLLCLLVVSICTGVGVWPNWAVAAAGEADVVGLWRTIDDKTHAPASIVETYLEGDHLFGRVRRVLPDGRSPKPACDKCSGELKGKPVEGLRIMWDLARSEGGWERGSILDPGNGTVYRCRVRMLSKDKLEVRGFVGISLFGRSQTWERIAPAEAGAASAIPTPSGPAASAPH